MHVEQIFDTPVYFEVIGQVVTRVDVEAGPFFKFDPALIDFPAVEAQQHGARERALGIKAEGQVARMPGHLEQRHAITLRGLDVGIFHRHR